MGRDSTNKDREAYEVWCHEGRTRASRRSGRKQVSNGSYGRVRGWQCPRKICTLERVLLWGGEKDGQKGAEKGGRGTQKEDGPGDDG